MNEPAEVTVDDVERRDARRLRFGLGCLAALVFLCCLPCVFAGSFSASRGKRALRFEPAPVIDPAGVADPVWKRVAIARRDAMSTSCDDVTGSLLEALGTEPEDVRASVVTTLRERVAALDTAGLRASCQAASMMSCDGRRFAEFRAAIVVLGQPVYELAARDPDAYVRFLPPSNRCRELADRIGVDGDTTTAPASREQVRALVPRTCRRFGCTVGDLFEDARGE